MTRQHTPLYSHQQLSCLERIDVAQHRTPRAVCQPHAPRFLTPAAPTPLHAVRGRAGIHGPSRRGACGGTSLMDIVEQGLLKEGRKTDVVMASGQGMVITAHLRSPIGMSRPLTGESSRTCMHSFSFTKPRCDASPCNGRTHASRSGGDARGSAGGPLDSSARGEDAGAPLCAHPGHHRCTVAQFSASAPPCQQHLLGVAQRQGRCRRWRRLHPDADPRDVRAAWAFE